MKSAIIKWGLYREHYTEKRCNGEKNYCKSKQILLLTSKLYTGALQSTILKLLSIPSL